MTIAPEVHTGVGAIAADVYRQHPSLKVGAWAR